MFLFGIVCIGELFLYGLSKFCSFVILFVKCFVFCLFLCSVWLVIGLLLGVWFRFKLIFFGYKFLRVLNCLVIISGGWLGSIILFVFMWIF